MRLRGLGVAVAAAAMSGVAVAPATAQQIEVGPIPKCTEAVPQAITILPDPDPITLSVHVLLDGVTTSRGAQVVDTMKRAFSVLNIPVTATYSSVNFTGTEADGLIQQAKNHFGGQRPAGSDLVYVLTSKDQTDLGNPGNVGKAACIGGIAYPDQAFATGEDVDLPDTIFGPIALRDYTAKTMAHEIGHLLGAHHHYANCAESHVQDLGQAAPCTLMFNDIVLASYEFSFLNGRVARGHAWWYARP